MLSDEEQIILAYLRSNPEGWFAAGEICRKASVRYFRKDPRWAYPVLMRMFMAKLVECDPAGHYRYIDLEAIEKERQERMRQRTEE